MEKTFQPIAIIGYGCVYPPDGYDVKTFWENVLSGKSGIRQIPENRWVWEYYYDKDRSAEDKTYCIYGGVVDDYEFPLSKYKLSAEDVKKFTRTQLMLLDTAYQAIEMSGLSIDSFANHRTSLFVGNMLGDQAFSDYSMHNRAKEFYTYLENSEEYKSLPNDVKEQIKNKFYSIIDDKFMALTEENFEGVMYSGLGKSVRNFLGIKGTSLIVDAACAAGALVIDEAVKHLQEDNMDTCFACAVLGNMNVTGNVAFAKIGGLSPTHSSPLDHKANGLIPGEGAGTIILKKLDRALADGNKIYGVIRGVGASSDGKGKAIYAPSSNGQMDAMKKAIDRAGLKPIDIDYIETHATSTLVGDKVEINTLKLLFEDQNAPNASVAIGSVKSQIGHSFSAAGMANLIKVLEGMRKNIMPPTHNFERAADEVQLEKTPFYVNTVEKTWTSKKAGEPKRASVNAFGFGGINASVLVEEYIEDYHKKLVQGLNKRNAEEELDIAIVGVGVLDGNGNGQQQWLESLKSPVSIKNRFPDNRWKKEINDIFNNDGSLKGSFIEKLGFPCIKYKIPPLILAEIDKSQQMALMAAGEAIADYGQDRLDPFKTSLYVGSMLGLESSIMADLRIRFTEYVELIKKMPEFDSLPEADKAKIFEYITSKFRSYIPKVGEDTLPGYMDNIIAGRVANFFNIHGTNAVVDSDSVSFTCALEQAIMSLSSGENTTAIVGGVHANMSPEFIKLFNAAKSIYTSSCPNCNAVLNQYEAAEGAVFFVIKKAKDVKADEKIYARIKGIKYEDELNDKVAYGNAQGNEIRDILKHSVCCSSFSGSDSKHPFYFGAHSGFLMLKAILALHNNEYSQLNKLNAASSDDNELTAVYSHSLLGGDYMILLDKKDNANVFCGSNDKPKCDCSAKEYSFYAGTDNWDELLERINRIIATSKIDSQTFEAIKDNKYRLAIVYKTEEELLRKLKAVI